MVIQLPDLPDSDLKMAFTDSSKTVFIPTLENLCLTKYLSFLESACAGDNLGSQPQHRLGLLLPLPSQHIH